jgi:succinate dehydrogenase / fumarate reductase, cytochrome b subunit
MNWFIETFRTSIGKKLLMAVTGLGFLIFILVHLMGNLTLFAGREAFTAYVDALHGFEAIILVAEIGLLSLAVIHVSMGLLLYLANRSARNVRYAVYKSGGGRNIGSATMPYTGVAIFLFVIIHLNNFTFADVTDRTMYDVVAATFSSVGYIIIYIAAIAALAVHIRHGFWSLFQSLGLNHDKYMPALRRVGIAFAVAVGVGFGLIPLFMGFAA